MRFDVLQILPLTVAVASLAACGDGFLRVDYGEEDAPIVIEAPESSTQPPTSETGTNSGGPARQGALECSSGEAFCQGACLDVLTNADHCGDCGVVCESGPCIDGACMGSAGPEDPETDEPSDPEGETPPSEPDPDPPETGDPNVDGVLAETNAARNAGANCGVYGQYAPTAALELDPELNEAAQAHADDMAAENFFSHTGSDGSSFVDRIGRTDFAGQPIGENIAAGQQSPQQAVDGWVASDGHCRNLMNPDATKIGIGFANGGPYGTLWVQVFGR